MSEAPACAGEVVFWVCQRNAVLILSQEYEGEGWLVLKSKKIIPVFQADMRKLSDVYGWFTHHIHMTPPKEWI